MAEIKTKQNEADVTAFLNTIEDESRRADAFTLLGLMQQATDLEPKLWGTSIIGFGSYHYRYESGHEGDTFVIGFSPRKTSFTLYAGPPGFARSPLLPQLGKHKTGTGCLYIKKMTDVDSTVLKEMFAEVTARGN